MPLKPAPRWKRLFAFSIDTIGIYLAFLIFTIPFHLFYTDIIPALAIIFLISLGTYFLIRDAYSVGSIGKHWMKVKTVTEKDNKLLGCTILQSISRNIFFIIPIFIVMEIIVMLIRKDGRRIGDLLANTQVISVTSKK
ncbi:hypothetical protein HOG48_05745 [Candidatus Peregrinibacteria bacterium]|jgi:uncharacterized RDD family membrane protein YckC|nr:hypothetical protein [Candidatus Peregrinibacteria bacterium]